MALSQLFDHEIYERADGGGKLTLTGVHRMNKAKNVDADVLKDCGHFMPEEHPGEVVRRILALARKVFP